MSDVSSTLTAHLALEGDTCQLRFLVCFAATVLAITMDWLSLSGTSDRLRLSITGFSLSSLLFPDISKTYRKTKNILTLKDLASCLPYFPVLIIVSSCSSFCTQIYTQIACPRSRRPWRRGRPNHWCQIFVRVRSPNVFCRSSGRNQWKTTWIFALVCTQHL